MEFKFEGTRKRPKPIINTLRKYESARNQQNPSLPAPPFFSPLKNLAFRRVCTCVRAPRHR